MKKWAAVIVCAALCLAVCVGAALVALSVLRAPQAEESRYVLRDFNGQLALFEPDGEAPVARYDVYTALLPEEDAALLREGIPVADQAQLQRLLEDFGL